MEERPEQVILAQGDEISKRNIGSKCYADIEEDTMRLAGLASIFDMPLSNNADLQAQIHALNHSLQTRENWTIMKFNHALLVMSLENVNLPNASNPPKNRYIEPLASPLLLDHPFNLDIMSNETSIVPVSEAGKAISLPPISYTLQLRDAVRNLEDYSILEVFETSGLLQELIALQATHPYIELFKHQHSEMTVLAIHTGFDGHPNHSHTLSSHTHTKVGFQNYLQYVDERYSHLIDEALKEDAQTKKKIEEEKREVIAQKLKEAEERQQEILTPVEEEQSADISKGRKKSESASHRTSVAKVAKKSIVSSANTDTPMSSSHDLHDVESLLPQFQREKRFIGYDMGDEVLLKESTHTTLFTADGIQIQSKKHRVLNSMYDPSEVSMLHDGHKLVCCQVVSRERVHGSKRLSGLDTESRCTTPQPENNRLPQLPSGLKSAYFHAHFKNSLKISYSHYGPKANGKLPYLPYRPKILDQNPQSDLLQALHPASQQGVSPKLSKKQQEHQQQLLEQQRAMEAQMERDRKLAKAKYQHEYDTLVRNNKYQQLHISTEFGLEVRCQVFIGSSDIESPGSVVIKQKYSLPSLASHINEHVSRERCRFYHSEGFVIKFMLDESIIILCADGTQYRSASIKEVEMFNKKKRADTSPQPEHDAAETEKPSRRVSSASKSIIVEESAECPVPNNKIWVVTTSGGDRFMFEEEEESKDLFAHECVEPADESLSTSQMCTEAKKKPVVVSLSPVHLLKATDPVTKAVSLKSMSLLIVCLYNII